MAMKARLVEVPLVSVIVVSAIVVSAIVVSVIVVSAVPSPSMPSSGVGPVRRADQAAPLRRNTPAGAVGVQGGHHDPHHRLARNRAHRRPGHVPQLRRIQLHDLAVHHVPVHQDLAPDAIPVDRGVVVRNIPRQHDETALVAPAGHALVVVPDHLVRTVRRHRVRRRSGRRDRQGRGRGRGRRVVGRRTAGDRSDIPNRQRQLAQMLIAANREAARAVGHRDQGRHVQPDRPGAHLNEGVQVVVQVAVLVHEAQTRPGTPRPSAPSSPRRP